MDLSKMWWGMDELPHSFDDNPRKYDEDDDVAIGCSFVAIALVLGICVLFSLI